MKAEEQNLKKMNKVFASRLRKALDLRKYSIVHLAEISGVSRRSLQGILAQERYPSLDTIMKISNALEVPVDFFTSQSFMMDNKGYLWNKLGELKEIKLVNPSGSERKNTINLLYKDTGERFTDSDLSLSELIEKKVSNKKQNKSAMNFLKLCYNSVDETTKEEINKIIINAGKSAWKVKEEYRSYLEDSSSENE